MTSKNGTSSFVPQSNSYQTSGVSGDKANDGLTRLVSHIRSTWSLNDATVKVNLGYFANVVDINGVGIAICTDGIGSKALVAQMLNRYDTVGIDCVAMNVNDLVCVGATPSTMVDYIAVEQADPDMLEAIGVGLAEGARQSKISISGGEVAQLKDIIKGNREGTGFDLAGTAIGQVDLNKVNIGESVEPGDLIIGIASNGIHSNGLTLARYAFFVLGGYDANSKLKELSGSIGDELLKPTYIYVAEALEILKRVDGVSALTHITGDGFLNLTRIKARVGFVIDNLPTIPPIFSLIKNITGSDNMEMFNVFNMGIGFCVIIRPQYEATVLDIIESNGKQCQRIGYITDSGIGTVNIEEVGIVMSASGKN